MISLVLDPSQVVWYQLNMIAVVTSCHHCTEFESIFWEASCLLMTAMLACEYICWQNAIFLFIVEEVSFWVGVTLCQKMLWWHKGNCVMGTEDSDWDVDFCLTLGTKAMNRLDHYLGLFQVVFSWRLVQNLTWTLKLADSISEIRRQRSIILLRDNEKGSFD